MAFESPIGFFERFGQQRSIATALVFITIFFTSLIDRTDISFLSLDSALFVLLMLLKPFLDFRLAIFLRNRFKLNHPNAPAETVQDRNILWPIVLIDAVYVGVAIGFIHCLLIPSLVFLAMLACGVIELGSLLLAAASIVICFVGAYLSSYFLGMDMTKFAYHMENMAVCSPPVCIVSIVSFVVYISTILKDADKQVQLNRHKYVESEKKNHHYIQIANKIARYAPSQVWQAIVNDSFESRIYNKRKKLTIFFSDIEGFTDLSDRLSSDDLAALLNTYFEKMSNIARKYGGTVDKFVGDALLIFFGDPTSNGTKDDAIACIDMAIAMQNEIKRLRQKGENSDLGALHVRMGVTTGYCHVGNFGSASRMSYTVIGHEANLAARLQAAAVPDEILISNETYEQVRSQINCVDHGLMSLRGITQPVQTWKVLGRYETAPTHLRRWNEYEFDGFNLQLDMDSVKAYDKERIKRVLQQTIENIERP